VSHRLAVALAIALILSPVAQADTVWLPSVRTPAPIVQWATVTHIADGDTLDVRLECCECIPTFRVRLLAIDTPERGECYYSEAKAALGGMVDGQRVGLERDVSERDSWGRLLRHVYTESGDWVNGAMVRDGYAKAKRYPPDTRRAVALEAMQAAAQREGRGGWAACKW
jgi:micrococcal nuclease